MNDSRTEVDSSKKQSLFDGTPSRKRRQIDNVEELVLANQNGATPLGGEIEAFENDDNHQEENSIELNAEAIPRDEEIELMQEFHSEIYETLPEQYPDLAFVRAKDHNDNPVLVITHRCLAYHPPFGFTSRIQITLRGYSYVAHVLMIKWESGAVKTMDEAEGLCYKFSSKAGYKFCPGIDPDYYNTEYYEVIRFHIRSVRQTTAPFARVDSVNCKLWFSVAQNASQAEKTAQEVKCSACKRMITDLDCQKRRTMAESPNRKLQRQAASSRARLSYMSPASQLRRKSNAQNERTILTRKVERINKTDVTLNDEQHDEMCTIVDGIGEESLEKIFLEASEHGVGNLVKDIWFTDSKRQQKQFSHDQANNISGARGNRWSMITIRIALAVYTRSPAAYAALKSFGILQLPSKATLQAYTGAFMHEPGASSHCIAEQVARYIVFKEQCRQAGKQEPKSDGVLIFDEVKVACQLMWNSRSHQLMGLTMTHKDQASLNDIYRLLREPEAAEQTSYILQFLWRDLTSEFDIVGPYFTASSSLESKFVISCVLETIKLFQLHGLTTSLLVCDGASSNAAAIKASHGHSGAYSVKQNENDVFKVEPWMINPFNPPHHIFWLICPSHQLKNMINALFSSKIHGTKAFQRSGKCTFGWKTIDDMYKRELARAQQNHARMVPRLKETHCLRDAWTKLNVLPAKIMQQEQVLGELHWYIHHDKTTAEEASITSETLAYLEACHLLFERGFLSHDRIRSLDSEVLTNINKGYKYFSEWLEGLLEKDPHFPHTSNTQREFLSWQTWDLLRIDVYSFNEFVKYFLRKHPTHFVSPLRISGSAVESLFSQYKFSAGGKLDSVNFTTSRCSHLVKQCVSNHHSGKDYRDQSINVMELPLKKHKYGKNEFNM